MNPLFTALAAASIIVIALVIRAVVFRRNRSRYSVKEIPNFLTPEECKHLIELAIPLVERSQVAKKGHKTSETFLRTSGSAYFTDSRDPVVLRVKRRIAEVSQTDLRCQEPLQVTHYDPAEFFAPHLDAIGVAEDLGPEGDRYCTMIMYLHDDFIGGQTRFHRIGVGVKPERGKAAFFTNLTEDGLAPEPLSFHGATTVISGEKWLLNQWIRQRPFASENRGVRRATAKNKRAVTH
jgi:prolyl 4-hydroxylase